jgi:hypothetical protein
VEEHYIKQTQRNRTYILGPNGVQSLIIPVKKINGNKTAMKDIAISYQESWVRQHLNALETAYSSSPFYEHYIYDIAPIYHRQLENLVEFNLTLHQLIVEKLDLQTPTTISSSYDLATDELDFRQHDEIPNSEVLYIYPQVFDKNCTFEGNLSVLDVLFNLGPMARTILTNKNVCK